MKLLTVIGARPQFVKAAAIDRAIRDANRAGAGIRPVVVHTGQHRDPEMSRVFFEDLALQAPNYTLDSETGAQPSRTIRMREGIEDVLAIERPDVVLVYGDTNSTLAGALAAARRRVPIAHVEAGIRSHNRRMREEFNRVVTDHFSDWLFCPTETAVANLHDEGLDDGVELVGDVMYEVMMSHVDRATLPAAWGVEPHGYVLATVHRAENTNDRARLHEIIAALAVLAADFPVVFPIHPRTRRLLPNLGVALPAQLQIVPPLRYPEMLAAQQSAAVVVTDSGGVQKEAFWLGVPCVTARDDTEWPETLVESRNVLAGAARDQLVMRARAGAAHGHFPRPGVPHARASDEIVSRLCSARHSSVPRL